MEAGRRKNIFELFEAIVLSVALVLTSWSAYQSARWSGVQALVLADAAAASRTALEVHMFTEEQLAADGATVAHILDALLTGRSNVVEFYVKRIRPELRAPVEAWLALNPMQNPNAPAHPFSMPQYTDRVLGVARAEEKKLRADADEHFALAHKAKQMSDRYVLFNVLLASVLFFTGVSGKFDPGTLRTILLILAAAVLFAVFSLLVATPLARN